ncbi:MAG: 3'-5' exonuclease, partial [Betaproteobacteria bacterium]|nr:3'-5' exonuclease [Betaproteobacteria bacterium]
YCEADTVNTYLLWLRFQLLRGAFTVAQHRKECAVLREALDRQKGPHWREFLSLWKS